MFNAANRLKISLLLKGIVVVSLPIVALTTIGLILKVSEPATARTLDGDGARNSDACTAPRDKIPGIFDFTAACIRHDICYSKVRKRNLGRQGLVRCDSRFRSEMLQHCNSKRSGAKLSACKRTAEIYYRGVRAYSRVTKI
ncbi:MAG: phospholipase A2 [Stenomitos frigidus ULC029]